MSVQSLRCKAADSSIAVIGLLAYGLLVSDET